MKRHYLLLSFLAVLFSLSSFAQKPSVGCMDKNIRLQADDIKQHYIAQGFTVTRDAMINMESMSPMPVMIELQKGAMYQLIFVGSMNAARIKMELFDGNDQKMQEQFVSKSRQQPNYILFSFAPEKTDTYLFTFMQKLKNEQMCGSLTILKLNPDEKTTEIKPYQ